MFQSPVLPLDEVVTSIKEHSDAVDVSEADFRRPDPHKWRQIWSDIIYQSLTGRTIEWAIQSIVKEIKIYSPNPEAYEEAAAQVAFTLCLRRVLNSCLLHKKFSLRDILHPSSKKCQLISSVFLNRQRFDNGLYDFLQDTKEAALKSHEEHEVAQKRNREHKQRLKADEDHDVYCRAERQKLEDEMENGGNALEKLKDLCTDIGKESEDRKLKKSELDAVKVQIKQALDQKNQESEKLARKIVSSPEKLHVELSRLKRMINDKRSELDKQEKVSTRNRLLLEETACKIDASTKSAKLALQFQDELSSNIEFCAEADQLVEQQNQNQEAITSWITQEEDLMEHLRVRRSQRHTHTNQSGIKQQAICNKLNDWKRFSEKITEECKSHVSDSEAKKERVEQLNMMISEKEAEIEAAVDELKKREAVLIQEIDAVEKVEDQVLLKLKMCFS